MRSVRLVTIVLLGFLISVLATGCRTTWYELELRPDGDTMQRKASMWLSTKTDGVEEYVEFDGEKLQHVSQMYGLPMPTDLAQRHEFEGEFLARLPADLTDGGWYLHQASALGSANSYIEHRDGGDKLSWNLETRQRSLNRLVDVWLAWLDSEFGEDERYPPLREFVDFVLRDDFWNASLYFWSYDTFGLVGKDGSDEEELQLGVDLLIRVSVYLAERDYFDPVELPEMVPLVTAALEAEQTDVVWSLILRGLATKLGTGPDEPLPWPMQDIVDDLDTYAASLELFVTESDTIRAMVETWEQEYLDSLSTTEQAEYEAFERRAAETDKEADPDEIIVVGEFISADGRPRNAVNLDSSKSILSQLSEMAFGLDIDLFSMSGSCILQVILHLPQEPLVTNGTWDEDSTVRWRENIAEDGTMGNRLPDVFHALWVEPAVEFQQKRFGTVVLDGEDLLGHVAWYMTLSAEQALEWNDFVTGLEPGPELIATLRDFSFSTDQNQGEAIEGAPSAFVSKIVRALETAQD